MDWIKVTQDHDREWVAVNCFEFLCSVTSSQTPKMTFFILLNSMSIYTTIYKLHYPVLYLHYLFLTCADRFILWNKWRYLFSDLKLYSSIFIFACCQLGCKLCLLIISSGCSSLNLFLTTLPCIFHFLVLVPSSITCSFCRGTWCSSAVFMLVVSERFCQCPIKRDRII